jgi:hypothetical protein
MWTLRGPGRCLGRGGRGGSCSCRVGLRRGGKRRDREDRAWGRPALPLLEG